MKNLFSIISVSFLVLAFSACGSKSDDKKDSPPPAKDLKVSYQIFDGCTTGQKIFTGSTEQEVGTAFCNAIKDESLNKNCGIAQRRHVFQQMQCPGQFPVSSSSGSSTVLNSQYAFSENGCGTGQHIFAASTEFSLIKALCLSLNNDELNRNCAKAKRQEKMNEENCKEYIDLNAKKMTNPKENPTQTTPSQTAQEEPTQEKPTVGEIVVLEPLPENEPPKLKDGMFFCGSDSAVTCYVATEYCLVTISADGNTHENASCESLPQDCDGGLCLMHDAKGKFTDNPDDCLLITAKQFNGHHSVVCRSGL